MRHLLLREGHDLLAYAQARPAPAAPWDGDGTRSATTVELLVHPGARGRGLGRSVADRLRRELAGSGAVHAWSHTDSPAAAALAAAAGLRRARELWRMERALGPARPLPPVSLPDGVRVRAFRPGRDEDAWLRLNARAFAAHPEQGAWGRSDFDARAAEPWFDPAGLLLLVSGEDQRPPGHLLAAHWTKLVGDHGEVYVLGVDPDAQGRGLGRVTALVGLHHLAGRGAVVVDLYVEGDNTAARRTYTGLGFARVATDVVFEGTA